MELDEPLEGRNISTWRESIEPLRLYRDFRSLQTEMHRARADLRTAEFVGDEDRMTAARARYVEGLQELARYGQLMERRGVRPADLHPDVLEDMRHAGIEPWTHEGEQ